MFSIGTVWLAILLSISATVMVELAYRAWWKVLGSDAVGMKGYTRLIDDNEGQK
jgi:hypothetical protein